MLPLYDIGDVLGTKLKRFVSPPDATAAGSRRPAGSDVDTHRIKGMSGFYFTGPAKNSQYRARAEIEE